MASAVPEERLVARPRRSAKSTAAAAIAQLVHEPRPHLYLGVLGAWIASLLWFHPRMLSLLSLAETPAAFTGMVFFVVFSELAWLYGFYNLGIIVFALIYRRAGAPPPIDEPLPDLAPSVAVLYTTCNDFVAESADSCVRQEYRDFHVYILDDSTEASYRERVDEFAARHPDRVSVVRRPDRRGFKAGNLNHGLSGAASAEPVFALVDADELLPPDFLRRTVPRLWSDPGCGFVQANHRCKEAPAGSLAHSLGVGINSHWRWYQPLRNRFGFVMLLGHGAVIRREAWDRVGGFPEIVSEDIAFAVRMREEGWRGYFAEDVVCYEEFPQSVRAFRVRHMKWTRGTCEFLRHELSRMLGARSMTVTEKLDVLFPTLNLPLSLFWFLFLIDANLVLPALFGERASLTLALGGLELAVPSWRLPIEFGVVYGIDFFLITLLTFTAPVLCFILDLARKPRALISFLAKSTTVYASLGPLTCLGILMYAVTGKAIFLVTGDQNADAEGGGTGWWQRSAAALKRLLSRSHPDHWGVRGFEIATGIALIGASLVLLQFTTLGLGIGFLLLPILHHVQWQHRVMRRLVLLPLPLILFGVFLTGLGLLGMQTVFLGYGFHF